MRYLLLLLVVLSLLPGCSSLSTEPPLNYNLTGQWQLNVALSDSPNLAALARSSGRRSSDAGGRKRQRGGVGSGTGRGQKNGGRSGGLSKTGTTNGNHSPLMVQVLIATQMSIEQNEESMGIDYAGLDYRDVSWGEHKREELTINTGWHEGNLVIMTEGGRLRVEETYILSDDGSRLTAIVELEGGKNDQVFTRVFERENAATEEDSKYKPHLLPIVKVS